MPQTYLEAVRKPNQSVNPLLAFLGMIVNEVDKDRAMLTLPTRPELIQGVGVVGGGILATLIDETMAHAILGGNKSGERTTTIDMNISYLRAVKAGEQLSCEARVAKRGSRVIFVEAIARTGDREVARGTGTFLAISPCSR
ncbi:PaaI family thioesterase [Pseudodesulfovibrio sediminis]|uniref:Thioesterase n=1 Tax=Pseudodesulfovibrio sediminis TaxID=2810563 RepID=A0ABM7P7D0_9BACT|nr:PaaI family thioesterase [Pseudodesulfovibrio sediminis]BCS88888.1 thioesterase [Pseudodesulfovibrio sediminis]